MRDDALRRKVAITVRITVKEVCRYRKLAKPAHVGEFKGAVHGGGGGFPASCRFPFPVIYFENRYSSCCSLKHCPLH